MSSPTYNISLSCWDPLFQEVADMSHVICRVPITILSLQIGW